ncbi:PREDICTED: uncharacterized protein LOC106816294 [Priapulus caudatus]|uniref:Uncharacterized protein LOC106816294 n=1 Tax=Priapulus caudatus TaxID=37621 RepID=A0ABM1EVZ1_PRICU|nr:PREDICTED: uncharacterized protein LOC106816294 [Priapulus caudatus]
MNVCLAESRQCLLCRKRSGDFGESCHARSEYGVLAGTYSGERIQKFRGILPIQVQGFQHEKTISLRSAARKFAKQRTEGTVLITAPDAPVTAGNISLALRPFVQSVLETANTPSGGEASAT